MSLDLTITFYEKMSSFNFENISFLLFNPLIDNEKVYFGNNAIPNIEVEDIKKMIGFIKKENCKIVMHLEEIEGYKIFQSEDTEGNIIEFYEIIK